MANIEEIKLCLLLPIYIYIYAEFKGTYIYIGLKRSYKKMKNYKLK